MSGTFDYRLFGFTIRSEIRLPEVFPATDDAPPDVTIRRGEIREMKSQYGLESEGETLLLNVPEVGRYRIRGGSEITVEAQKGVPERNVRLYLLGSAFGALLHQRGMLPLHANAVDIQGKAVAFMGAPGAGKSTLAAWFHDQGHTVIADDVCVVGFGANGQPYAFPGLPRLRLWAEALAASGRDASGLERSYVDSSQQLDKFDVPLPASAAARTDVPLAALYVLDSGAEFTIRQLHGIEAAEAIFANTYRGSYVTATGNHKVHWEAAVRLVRALPVHIVTRQWSLAAMDPQSRRLLDHIASQGPIAVEPAAST